MNSSTTRIILSLLVFASAPLLTAQNPLPSAAPPYYRVRYKPSSQPGELAFGVSYTVWIPPGVKTLRGVIVHQHGCGEGACTAGQTAAYDWHWQALAKAHGCALLGPSYEQPETANCGLWCDPRNGSEKKFLQALADLAVQTKHPELATVPWALWGHSGGAAWTGTMLMLHPDRIVAVWLRSGTPRLISREDSTKPPLEIPAAALGVPVMCNLGTREGVTDKKDRFARVWETTQPFFLDFRAKGGLIGVAVDPNSSHDCGNSRYLAIPWLDACLAARLPAKIGTVLEPMTTRHAWLAPLLGNTALPAAQFTGDPKSAVWLPNERIATAWAEYVKDGNVSDPTPPPAPLRVRIGANGQVTWEADADLESGIAAFIIERDGVEVGRLPEKPAGTIGRRIFQMNGYSDTPTPPLAEMQFTDTSADPGTPHRYQVFTLNSVGLKSKSASLTNADISRTELLDRIHGGWVGMLIGGLEGLPHEFKYKAQPRDTLPEFTFLENGARSDDDNDFEWPHLFFMDKEGTLKLPYPRIVEIWKANMNSGIWIANKKARELMDQGVVPPETGCVARNPAAWYNLSGQFCVESYGLIAPGMPQSAADLGLHYTRIAVSEEPLQAAQFWTSLIALRAFHQGSMDDALQQATAAVDPKSAMAEVVADTRKAFQAHPDDWKAARQEIDAKWRVQRKWNDNSTPVNGAAVCLALLYGRDDFYRTLQYAMALGYDADCNAATAGAIIGVRRGFQHIAALPQFKMPDHYVNKTRPQLPAECKVSEQAVTLLRVAERVILSNGGEKITVSGQSGYRIKLQTPQVRERLPEKVHSPENKTMNP